MAILFSNLLHGFRLHKINNVNESLPPITGDALLLLKNFYGNEVPFVEYLLWPVSCSRSYILLRKYMIQGLEKTWMSGDYLLTS
jgi:hypothetical protein